MYTQNHRFTLSAREPLPFTTLGMRGSASGRRFRRRAGAVTRAWFGPALLAAALGVAVAAGGNIGEPGTVTAAMPATKEPTSDNTAPAGLRYRFRLGDQLVYERRTVLTSLETGQDTSKIVDQVQLWVLERGETEWLLLLDLIHIPDRKQTPLRGLVVYLDDFGRLRTPEEQLGRLEDFEPAYDVIPALPTPIQSDSEWAGSPDPFGRRWISHNAGADGEQNDQVKISWTREDDSGASEALGAVRSGRYWYDQQAGYITRLEAEGRHRVANVSYRTALVLRQRKEHDESWTRKRASEARQYLRCLQLENSTLDDLVAEPSRAEELMNAHERIWAAFYSDVEPKAGSPFEIIAVNERNITRDLRSHWQKWADVGRRWIGKPAGEWTLEKPDGRSLQSSALRTAITIEFFWQTDPSSLRVLEAARQIQRAYLGKQVRVVCLNMDLDPALARRSIGKCGHDLMHALAAQLQTTENLPTLPAVRVLDAEGVVRGAWLGPRSDYSELRSAVDRLLP